MLVRDQDPACPHSRGGLLPQGVGLPAGTHSPSPRDLRARGSWWWEEEREAGIRGGSSHFSLFQKKCLRPLISTAPKRPAPNELKLFTTTTTTTSPWHIFTYGSPSSLLGSLPTSIKGLHPLPIPTVVLLLSPKLEVLSSDTPGAERWDGLAGARF